MTKASRGSTRLLPEFRLDDCRKIPITLIDTEKGEQTAQACAIACLQHL
jgi:hypothetical protein